MKNLEAIIKKLTDKWFLKEPVLFPTFCTHALVSNDKLSVPFRVGKRKIEYAPHILENMDDDTIEECLKIEVIRILLKHPYQRQPTAANPIVMAMASNVTINDSCRISNVAREFLHGLEYDLPDNLCFEEYYEKIKHLVPTLTAFTALMDQAEHGSQNEDAKNEQSQGSRESGDSDSDEQPQNGNREPNQDGADQNGVGESGDDQNSADTAQGSGSGISGKLKNILRQSYETAAEWKEDEETCCDINKIIEEAQRSNQWGNMPGDLVSLIKASCRIEMDYRRMLSHFRTSVLSSRRYLTRMKPSRRYGFDAMGSRYALASNLLIAVDVSGSVTDKSLSNFFSIINRFFKYGIEKLDVIQFDAELKGEPIPMKKARSEVKIIGRGGTSFQPAADYYCAHPEYDGLIYFTDGYAPLPTFNTKRPIDVLWVLCGRQEYEECKDEINKIARNRATYIPRGE